MKRIIKHIIMTVVMVACIPASVSARITAADVFVNAPVGIFPLLDRNTRLDMIDYFRSGSTTASANRLSGQSRVTRLSDDNIVIELTEASRCQIAVLPASGDTVIAFVKTVDTPVPDSRLTFYATDWKEIDKPFFQEPVLTDWLTREGEKNRKDAEAAVPFVLAEYSYEPETRRLVLTGGMQKFYSPEEYDRVKAYLKPSLSYLWTGKKMKLEK